MKRSRLVREIVETVVLTVLIFLVIRFVIQSYHVEGQSMETTLTSSNYVLVNKIAYLFHQPERGDVIVFHYPLDTTRDFIKRVIGLPGDTVRIDSNHVWVNGILLNEPYVQCAVHPTGQPCNPDGQTRLVPANQFFVMGDNRPVSDDSRDWGFVPKDYIVGKAVLVYWPANSWSFVNTYSAVFAQIKPPATPAHAQGMLNMFPIVLWDERSILVQV